MRIVCENCSTKYSIADEKVRGKVFKIRCKKCGHIIVVKGAPEQPASAAGGANVFDDKETRVFDYSGFEGEENPGGGAEEPIWHVVIDKEQVGPLTGEQVRQKFAGGEIDTDTYVWREGFADWVRLGAVDEFADLEGATVAAESPFGNFGAAGAAEAAPSESEPSAQADGDLFGAAAQPEPEAAPAAGGLFGGGGPQAQPAGGGLFDAQQAAPRAAEADAGAGLFGAAVAQQAPAAGGGSFGAPAATAQDRGALFPDEEDDDQQQPAMTGQRNENSVLFSLSNLQALATGGPKKSANVGLSSPASASPSPANKPSGGSGLLDIRAMAASTLGNSGGGGGLGGGMNDAIAMPSAFAGPIAAPVLMPVASDRPRWLIPAMIMGGVLLVAVIVLGVIVVMRMGHKPAPKQVVVAQKNESDMGVDHRTEAMTAANLDMVGMEADSGMAGMDAMAPSGDMGTASGGASAPASRVEPKSRNAGRRHGRSRGGRSRARNTGFHSARSTGSFGVPGTTRSTPRFSRHGGGSDPLAALLSRAARPRHTAATSRPSAPSISKQSLNRSDIKSGINRVKSSVRRCYDKYKVPGMIRVGVTVKGSSGRVSSASIRGKFSGTPTGRCVSRAVRRAHFAKFARSSQSFTYPFILR